MLLAGDELGHTQKGNNNTYCQDNELTWLNWELDEGQQEFLEFVKKAVRIWHEQPVFQRRKFFQGRPLRGSGIKDISFFDPAGKEMSDEDWNAGFVKCLGVRLAGDLIDDEDERGEPIVGRHAAAAAQRPSRGAPLHAAANQAGASLGAAIRHRGAQRRDRAVSRRRAVSTPGSLGRGAANTRAGRDRGDVVPWAGSNASRRRPAAGRSPIAGVES